MTGTTSSRVREDVNIYEDVPDRTVNDFTRRFNLVGKENSVSDTGVGKGESRTGRVVGDAPVNLPASALPAAMSAPLTSSSLSTDPSPSRISKKVASDVRKIPPKKPRPKPRIGIRRL